MSARPPMDFAGSIILLLFVAVVLGGFGVIVGLVVWQQLIEPAASWLAALYHL